MDIADKDGGATLRVQVEVSTPHPILWAHLNAVELGEMFGRMSDESQAIILREMMAALWQHGMQADYVAIALNTPEFAETTERLRYLATMEA